MGDRGGKAGLCNRVSAWRRPAALAAVLVAVALHLGAGHPAAYGQEGRSTSGVDGGAGGADVPLDEPAIADTTGSADATGPETQEQEAVEPDAAAADPAEPATVAPDTPAGATTGGTAPSSDTAPATPAVPGAGDPPTAGTGAPAASSLDGARGDGAVASAPEGSGQGGRDSPPAPAARRSSDAISSPPLLALGIAMVLAGSVFLAVKGRRSTGSPSGRSEPGSPDPSLVGSVPGADG